jgi:hypothetical protein
VYTPSQTVLRSVFLAGSCGRAGRVETPLVIMTTNVRIETRNIEDVFRCYHMRGLGGEDR